MTPQVSVIIPVYNAEAYLHDCLRSILMQTMPDIEVLIIDDGSTDGSFALMQQYAKTDSRVRSVHQQNAGPSRARNAGIAMAQGRYIAFVDADDWLEEDMCQRMLKVAGNDADIVFGNTRVI